MKKENNRYLCLLGLLTMINFSCKNSENRTDLYIKGPYYDEEIIKQFGLDSLPFNIRSKELYIATLENNSDLEVMIESTSDGQIFPDSCWLHSYAPYAAENRSWSKSSQAIPEQGIRKIKLQPNETKLFWFSNYYDDYIDSMTIYFTLFTQNGAHELFVNQIYETKEKPKINYELVESNLSMEFTDQTKIEINIEGPFTYKKANSILNLNIPYTHDIEEVFIFDIKNKRDENLYIERWDNDEINIDTIYSYAPFTQTATEYLWIESTNKKGTIPTDTIVLKPQESHKFWDTYENIWPKTDSIAFKGTFRTDEYLIKGFKIFEVKKKKI